MARILVVDDDKDMCQLISEILQEESCEVNISYNGEDALSKIKENSYDLVILDYKLFGISGLVVLEKARQVKPSIKVIMISAFGDDSTKAKARELGAFDFIDKPFDIKRFIQAVQDILIKKTVEKE
jgi:DNA-binding NtrC family response regulator